MSDTAERVRSIMAENLGVAADRLTDEAVIQEDLEADSLDVVELVMAFEEEFDIEIPDDAVEELSRVKDAIDYIEKHKE